MNQQNPFNGLFTKLDGVVDYIYAGLMMVGGSLFILAIGWFGLKFAMATDPHEKSEAKARIKNILIGGAVLAGSSTFGKALFDYFKE